MPSPTLALSPTQLAADLGVRDLTDPAQGDHAALDYGGLRVELPEATTPSSC